MRRFRFRIAIPAVMLAVLFLTLRAAEREVQTWIRTQTAPTSYDVESMPFFFSLHHSAWVMNAICFQWPAFAVAAGVAPVPQPYYFRRPVAFTWASYMALTLVVGTYWFAIAVWMDRRFTEKSRPSHCRAVRIILVVVATPVALCSILFLAKDLVSGWQHGPQGAYGLTAWLAIATAILLTELAVFHRKPVDAGSS